MVDQENKFLETPKPVSPETAPKAPETAQETKIEFAPMPKEDRGEAPPVVLPPIKPVVPVQPSRPKKDVLTEEIEEVLSEDLQDLYKHLPPDKQKKFKEEGEKTANLIQQMIIKGKFHGRKILQLIIEWLRIIPGVNLFFLEQESKIKADKIIRLAEEEKRKHL